MHSNSAELLRSAVQAGDYREIERILEVYRGDVEARWHASASAEERTAISDEVMGLLGWARQTILAARAHSQRKLIHLTRQAVYANAADQHP
jgi:hypothetical protein